MMVVTKIAMCGAYCLACAELGGKKFLFISDHHHHDVQKVHAFHRYRWPNAAQVLCTTIDKGCYTTAVEDRTRDTRSDLA